MTRSFSDSGSLLVLWILYCRLIRLFLIPKARIHIESECIVERSEIARSLNADTSRGTLYLLVSFHILDFQFLISRGTHKLGRSLLTYTRGEGGSHCVCGPAVCPYLLSFHFSHWHIEVSR